MSLKQGLGQSPITIARLARPEGKMPVRRVPRAATQEVNKMNTEKIVKAVKYQLKNIHYRMHASEIDPDLWLVSERGFDAQDNGYALYKYLVENKELLHIRPVYVIDEDSRDYDKVKALGGEIVEPGTKEHYELMYTAGVLASTHTYGYTPDKEIYYRLAENGLFGPDGVSVFLQHGVLDKVTHWLYWESYQPDLFCISSPYEYKVVREDNQVPPEHIMATGMPRYDALDQAGTPKKQVLIMPTWRQWLKDVSKEDFKNSVFFKKWRDVIQSQILSKSLEEKGYSCVFYLHPELAPYKSLFTSAAKNTNIVIEDSGIQQHMMDSVALVTDYSSTYLDMIRMGRQVIFYQFDTKRYNTEHYSGTILNYENYGAVATSATIISTILMTMDGAEFGDKQKKEKLFYFYDGQQCARVVQRIRQAEILKGLMPAEDVVPFS